MTGVEMFLHKEIPGGGLAGMNVGCLIRGIKREDVERGLLAKPGSINPHTRVGRRSMS